MSEAQFNIDDAEQQYNDARGEGEDDQPPADPPARKDPPTYMSHDEWVAAGRDPEDYIGKNAFQKRHDDIQNNKKLRKEIKGLNTTVQQTMDAVTDWQSQERGRLKSEIEAELHKAKEDEDIDGALDAQRRLDDIDEPPPPANTPPAEHSVIADFRENNPMLDAEAEEFDEEFNADVEAFYNGMAQQLSHNGKKALTDGQITRCLKKALKETRELHEINDEPARRDDGESPRNKRQTQGRSTKRGKTKAVEPRAEDYKLENPRNSRQVNAATEVRDMIHEKAMKEGKKRGMDEKAAKTYADEQAQNFERSLVK